MKRVFVAMSGGVDSSVAAALLKEQGYDVRGVFMQGWSNPHFECSWKEDRRDTTRVAATLGIPFQTLDVSREYYDRVVLYLLEEYRVGRTPNPDVMCNKEIKFGLFYRWAMERGADYIATGHYSKIQKSNVKNQNENSKIKILIAKDGNKDQSYFLWTLTQDQLRHCLFPLGDYMKSEVRELARKFGLHTADKKDSQGICFVGEGNIADFLRDHITPHRGAVVTADGRTVGEHDGIELFTIGQRHGIGVRGGPQTYYVAAKDSATATLLVAEGDTDPILYKKEICFRSANWNVGHSVFNKPFRCEARIRYRAPLAPAMVFFDEDRSDCSTGKVVFDAPQRAVAPGQSIVFYHNGQLLGGGIIDPVIREPRHYANDRASDVFDKLVLLC